MKMANKKVFPQKYPVKIPAGDNKLIEEYFGKASIEEGDYSLAHMIAPPNWSEPYQQPEFDEITYLISGRKQIEVEDEKIFLKKGESILVKKGARVRYSNPFDEECEYISVCIPAFTPERVNREE
jgi:mannose-6-phosphate isomerase-like protein (cupin superfamily)